MKKQSSFAVVEVMILSFVFVAFLLKRVAAERENNELIQNQNHPYQIRGNKYVIFDTASEVDTQTKDGRETQDMPDTTDSITYGFGSHRLRGRKFEVADTSIKKSKPNILVVERTRVHNASRETDSVEYDFGRRHNLQRKRLQSNMISSETKAPNRSTVDARNSSKHQISSRKKRRANSKLDVDVKFLESFLISKQKKREKKHSTSTIDTKQDTIGEELKRFLESSSDLSYVYSSIPTPSPTAVSYEPSSLEPTTIGEVPTLNPTPSSSAEPTTITPAPSSEETETSPTSSPTYFSIKSSPTTAPTYLDLESSPTSTPTYLSLESSPTLTPTYLDLESSPTSTPTYLNVESSPTSTPTYLDVESSPTSTPTYLSLESSPTSSPTYLDVIQAGTNTPTYLSLDVVPTMSPTYLETVSKLSLSNPCPEVLSKSKTLEDDLILYYDVVVDDGRQVFCSELEYDDEGWLGLGVSESGEMIGSTAVIGLPDSNTASNPGLYSLDGKTNSLVTLLPDNQQNILFKSITQESGTTVMRFAKYIDDPDDDDFVIKVPGVTTFIYAASDSNDFGYHGMKRGSVSLVLSNAKSLKKEKKERTQTKKTKEQARKKKSTDR